MWLTCEYVDHNSLASQVRKSDQETLALPLKCIQANLSPLTILDLKTPQGLEQ